YGPDLGNMKITFEGLPVILAALLCSPLDGAAVGGMGTVRGIYEVDYNDRFVAELKPQLEKIGWQVLLTRKKDQTATLGERVQMAINKMPIYFCLFITIQPKNIIYKPLNLIIKNPIKL
ncbi:MAG: N-acetylmuramoyl-L-alanine amidase, partial [Neisseriaceae bacterium]|nr:N-acetylmuramoyl-L-alanine amidase [Neisseriaceae bacterium]